jgi:protein ImuA
MSAGSPSKRPSQVAALREAIAAAEVRRGVALPFGVAPLDDGLADHGIATASLHEIAAASPQLSDDAAASLFAAGLGARFVGDGQAQVLWIVTRHDLYAPGLEQAGLPPGRILYAQARDDVEVLALTEDGLRDGSLAAVIGEVRRAGMTATRRLQLAAAEGATPALLFRRWRKAGLCPLAEPSAATTRWRIGCAPSARLGMPGVGRARWSIELARQRGGNPFSLLVEACDDTGRLALPADAADRAAPAVGATARAA